MDVKAMGLDDGHGGIADGAATAAPARRPKGVYDALFEEIVTGKLRAGERLMIDELAERFGVSKLPVREALKALDGRGWVESAPRRGTYVRRLSLEERHELFELRLSIEPEFIAMAPHRHPAPHMTPK